MSNYKDETFAMQWDLSLWRKVLRFLKPYKGVMVRLILVMLLVAVIDAIFPVMTRKAVDQFIVPGNTKGLAHFFILYGAIALVQGLNVLFLILLAGRIETHVCHDIRETGFKHLQELSFSYYDRTSMGWIMSRMTSDSRRLGQMLSWAFVDMFWGLGSMIAITVFMLIIDWRLALFVLAAVPPLAVTSVFFQKRLLKGHRKVRHLNSRISAAFSEGIASARTTKTLVREEGNLADFRKISDEMRKVSVKTAILSSLYLPIVLTLASIATALVLKTGGVNVTKGIVTAGTLVAFLSYTVQFFEPIRELARVLADLQASQASVERVMSMIDTQVEVRDTDAVTALYGDCFTPQKENWPEMKGDIEFRDVSFNYKEGPPIFTNFNLKVPAGERIAIVGETGSGKSTLVNLICRFYEPVGGSLLVDGVDYRERGLAWMQSRIGLVLQDPHLFSGTIMDNIRYGKPGATEDEIINAARIAHAHDLIMKLEKGYSTQVGEGGGKLSTGEKQLVSIARMVIADPVICVLDEATSSIDTETEKRIQSALDTILKGRTCFMIAHRLSTVRSADRILVMEKGNIVEEGKHNRLMDLKGRYFRFYTGRFEEEKSTVLMTQNGLEEI